VRAADPPAIRGKWRKSPRVVAYVLTLALSVTFILMLLAVVGFVAYRVTSAEQREHVFAMALEYFQQASRLYFEMHGDGGDPTCTTNPRSGLSYPIPNADVAISAFN